MFTYAASVIRVVDGDTVDVDIDLGFEVWVRNVRLRLSRINAYETRLVKGTTAEDKTKGLEAKELVRKLCEDNPTQITITTKEKGKYGRWIAELYVGDINVSDFLVNKSLAWYQEY